MMITNHRKKEFGTLLAIGFKPRWIVNSVAIEYVIISMSGVIIMGVLLKAIFVVFFSNGIYVPWEAMQVAYLSTRIQPLLYFQNILVIAVLFGFTSYLAVLFSLRKLKIVEIKTLLASHT